MTILERLMINWFHQMSNPCKIKFTNLLYLVLNPMDLIIFTHMTFQTFRLTSEIIPKVWVSIENIVGSMSVYLNILK